MVPLHAQEAGSASQSVSPDVMKKIEALTQRVEQLEQQLRERQGTGQPAGESHSARASAPVARTWQARRFERDIDMRVGEALVSSSSKSAPVQPTKPNRQSHSLSRIGHG